MPLTTSVFIDFVADYSSSSFDLQTPTAPVRLAQQITLASGVGANAADRIYADTRVIAASATDSLDMAGSLTDAFGVAFTPARIKGLFVRASAANVNNVNVLRPATNGVPTFLAASGGLPLKPGGVFLWLDPSATGSPVTATTGDLIDFVNSGAGSSVTYDVVILAASA